MTEDERALREHDSARRRHGPRKGWVLSIFRKGDDGRWRICRDANLMTRAS